MSFSWKLHELMPIFVIASLLFWLHFEQLYHFQNQHFDNESRISQTSKPIRMGTIQNHHILIRILYQFDNLNKFRRLNQISNL